jgi:hypothetical protein
MTGKLFFTIRTSDPRPVTDIKYPGGAEAEVVSLSCLPQNVSYIGKLLQEKFKDDPCLRFVPPLEEQVKMNEKQKGV